MSQKEAGEYVRRKGNGGNCNTKLRVVAGGIWLKDSYSNPKGGFGGEGGEGGGGGGGGGRRKKRGSVVFEGGSRWSQEGGLGWGFAIVLGHSEEKRVKERFINGEKGTPRKRKKG